MKNLLLNECSLIYPVNLETVVNTLTVHDFWLFDHFSDVSSETIQIFSWLSVDPKEV